MSRKSLAAIAVVVSAMLASSTDQLAAIELGALATPAAREHVKSTPVRLAPDLIGELTNAIGTATDISSTLRNPLTVKLNAARNAIAKNNTEIACQAMTDFVGQVTEKRGKGIPVATADAWLQTAENIQSLIGCFGC